MEFRILGPLEARSRGSSLPLGGTKQRAVLAQLLLRAGEVVSCDRLVEGLWQTPPETATKAVQVHISQLRKALAPHVAIHTRARGYVLEVAAEDLDLSWSERLRAEGLEAQAAGDLGAAASHLHAALALWRGPPLAEFVLEPFVAVESPRLEELELATLEERIDVDLALGRHGGLVPELEALVAANPLRERIRGQLMLALYRCGRQAAALECFREARRLLVDELGIEPGPALQRLERSILVQEPELELPLPPSGRSAPPEPPVQPPSPALVSARPHLPPLEVRKTVTTIFCDVTGSTTLGEARDPELMRRVMSRYFDEMRTALQGHGGTVEKFIGDAVMAVFGTPVLHEDDALRALRAALEMRDRLATLNDELEESFGVRLEIRIGVCTGEVVAGDPTRAETFVTGDSVIVAQRLEAAAEPGEILIAESTYRLARGAVLAEPLEPMALKGKAKLVQAYRLLGLGSTSPGVPRLRSPMVGRGREHRLLQDAFARAVQSRACHLFTVLGPAGVGKSRLLAEGLAEIGDRARVLSGSCLPYGEGITFRPVAEIVAQAFGADPRAGIEAMVGGPEAGVVAEHVTSIVGRDGSGSTPEEAFWAIRRLFEALSRERPLVLVFDDVNWAEPTLLDLIEHVADWVRDVPLLVVCMARPELLDGRGSWGGGKHNATSIFLEPLTAPETGRLARNLLGRGELDADLAARIERAAGGNPLFVEEMVALLLEEGLIQNEGGRWSASGELRELPVPPSIQVLLAARLDLLPREERQVLERAAVEGQRFRRSAVERLSEESPARIAAALGALVRKELVRPAGDDAFRFRHLLIRDAAYEALPKQLRADLHERLARWLDEREEEDELVGYHLEQAVRYRADLGRTGGDLAGEAAARLAGAGRRALGRGDVHAAGNLLDRASALLAADDPRRLELAPELGLALTEAGELVHAEEILSDVVMRADGGGSELVRLGTRIERAALRLKSDPKGGWERDLELVESSLPTLDTMAVPDRGVDRVLGRGWFLVGLVRGLWTGQVALGESALERARIHARAAGDRRQEAEIVGRLGLAAWSGPLPVPEGIERCLALLESAEENRFVIASCQRWLGALVARQGKLDEARGLVDEAALGYEELGTRLNAAATLAFGHADIESLAGDPVSAESALRRGYVVLEQLGELGYRASIGALLARSLQAQGRSKEAAHFSRIVEETASKHDLWSQVILRLTRARSLADAGLVTEAVTLARETVFIVEQTDLFELHGDVLLELGEILRLGGRDAEMRDCVERALGLYERKANVVSAARARALLEASATRA
ncbi:MAG: AAA family ATPase [Gaiellaceae bacterium MAG52_C11]|nr:AAA family ATPase [Candidatus Gaiellasilicea maunaloa]